MCFVLIPAIVITIGCGRPPITTSATAAASPRETESVGDKKWLQPSEAAAEPIWGIKDGLAVGLWPTAGPRGLIRFYAPYLGQRPGRVVNFIAIEPVVKGARGQSELETSSGDKQPGLVFWTADSLADVSVPQDPTKPASGRVDNRDGTEVLTFFLATEPFSNGAKPIVEVLLRAHRPHEIGLRIYAAKDSAPMDSCVLTATMGNYGRLRRLWLNGEVVDSRKLWPDFQPDAFGFAPWRAWPRERLFTRDGEVFVAATSDESDLAAARYESDVSPHWRYEGTPATHYWRTVDVPGLVARVNGRTTFWGSRAKIPGGIAYENFELEAPFAEGQEFWFGITPERPNVLGFDPEWGKTTTDGR